MGETFTNSTDNVKRIGDVMFVRFRSVATGATFIIAFNMIDEDNPRNVGVYYADKLYNSFVKNVLTGEAIKVSDLIDITTLDSVRDYWVSMVVAIWGER